MDRGGINSDNPTLKKAGTGILLLGLGAMCWFCIFYFTTGYDTLSRWFTDLNGCFYRNAHWQEFFTPAIKAVGDRYCMLGVGLSIAGAIYLLWSKKRERQTETPLKYNRADMLVACIALIVATLLWLWGKTLAVPSTDEVFSADNFASLHPFQTLSYYALPNNHILFNLLNNLLFHAVADKVNSGKMLSLLCYLGIILLAFYCMKGLLHNRWSALIAVVVLSLQFPVWGFGFQARGYELLALTDWGSFILLWQYLAKPDEHKLKLLVLTSAAGYLCLPSFLYFHTTILAVAMVYQLANKKVDMRFWKYQVISAATVFLLYLPCLSFSGADAITANKYVLPQSYEVLTIRIIPMFKNYLDYCFCNVITGHYAYDLILFLLPLSLFLYRENRNARFIGLFYITMWLVCFLLTVIMKIYPIDRALTGQFSITLAAVLYSAYLLITKLAARLRMAILPWVMLPLTVLLMINFVQKGRSYAGYYIYHYPVNLNFDLFINDGIKTLPKDATIGFSDEAFYWYHFAIKEGYKAMKCANGTDYYIARTDEVLPNVVEQNYVLTKEVLRYQIFKRR